MNRADFHDLARARLAESRLLLKAKRYSAWFYLAGFAVECALKACIAKQTRRFEFPDKAAVNESYVHDLKKLVRRAGLQPDLDRELKASRAFKENWAVVKDWANDSRYNNAVGYPKTRHMYQAVTARRAGVMQWLRRHW
jgi:HEPN domain-containing protein